MPSYMLPQSSDQPPPEERPPVARLASYGTTPLSSHPSGAVDAPGAQQSTLAPSLHHRPQPAHLQQQSQQGHAGFGSAGEARRNNGEWYLPQQQQQQQLQTSHHYQQQQQSPSVHRYSRPLPADAVVHGTGNSHHLHPQQPLSGDRGESAKRLRNEHSHSLQVPINSPHHGQESPYSYFAYTSGSPHNGITAAAAASSPTPPTSVIAASAASCESPHRMAAARQQMGSESVSISPVPSSSGHGGRRIQGSSVAAPHSGAPLPSPSTARAVIENQSSNGNEARDYHGGEEADVVMGASYGRQGHSRDSASRREQKRRLNQACLLCRRKKIKCDSVHPSCSNCQRRGIQCIYPEVRKRGRPPRTYTFADFALPGQPLPPELHGIADVHASAMLPMAGGPSHGWRAGVAAAAEYGGPGSGAGVSGASTPGYTLSEYDPSPALPPIGVAVGRGGAGRGAVDPMLLPTPALGVDQAVLDLFEYVTPGLPIVHRQTLVQNIRDRSLTLPLWLAIHAVSARFDTHFLPPPAMRSGPALGAGYAEKTHAILVNRFGHRQPRPVWGRNERGRMVVARDMALDHGGASTELSRREVIELLQTHVLLSIYYSGNCELELAVETHAAAVRIAQRMGVHLMDDPCRLPGASGIFNPVAAQSQRKRARDWGPASAGGSNDVDRQSEGAASADTRRDWIEYETLRRIWWAMYILDRTYGLCAASPRMIHVSAFCVRLPCSDLEWDSMHALPTAGSPSAPIAAGRQQPSGLMVRTFREAVMHTSLSEQAANEIAAAPSTDPNAYRYTAALAGLIDSVMDFADDIRALATPPLLEGTEILAQLRAELQLNESSGGGGEARSSAAVWLGSRKARCQFSRTGRSGWHAPSVSAAWPPDWRSRMRVLQERAAALEAQFTEWYSSMPIAQLARNPYLYSQLPLQDRITYFHQQIAYYGGVIQLQSLVVMAHGLLLPDCADDGSATFGPSALTSLLWRSLMDMDAVAPQLAADIRSRRPTTESASDPMYASRRRQYASHSPWTPRRHYGASTFAAEGLYSDSDDGAPLVPLDEDGNSPEIIREELQRMVQAAWCRCTEAAIAMSSAVKRATEVCKVASANPKTTYYDPTFRPQVLPPYRGDVVSGDPSASSAHRYERPPPVAGEMRASPQQPHMSTMSMHGLAEGLARSPLPTTTHSPYQPQQHSKSPSVANPSMVVDSAAGPGQVIDDATFFMRFNMFTSSAAYIGACIHLQNLKVTPRWEQAIRRHTEAVAKLGGDSTLRSMAEARDMGILSSPQDLGALPPPPPPSLPALPCTPDQAREGVKPLVKILEGVAPYWRVGDRVDRIRAMWREIEGSDLLPSAQVLTSPSARIPGPPPMLVPGLDQGYQHQQRSPVPPRHHHHHHQSPPFPPIHHRQSSLSSISIAALSNDSHQQLPPSIRSRQLSVVGPPLPPPPPPSAMMVSSHQHTGMPPPPRP
ncbi:hypothetical protein GGI20_004726 [Coemansia sp. BCRC 34301]|nr:hypothetical protein GGI20_004726 [Coemansia sp. BCRC 34301]